jgi:hypothetical protein
MYLHWVQTRWVQGRNELFINKDNGTFTVECSAIRLHFSGYATQSAFFDMTGMAIWIVLF